MKDKWKRRALCDVWMQEISRGHVTRNNLVIQSVLKTFVWHFERLREESASNESSCSTSIFHPWRSFRRSLCRFRFCLWSARCPGSGSALFVCSIVFYFPVFRSFSWTQRWVDATGRTVVHLRQVDEEKEEEISAFSQNKSLTNSCFHLSKTPPKLLKLLCVRCSRLISYNSVIWRNESERGNKQLFTNQRNLIKPVVFMVLLIIQTHSNTQRSLSIWTLHGLFLWS